jgi:hypothetical protein
MKKTQDMFTGASFLWNSTCIVHTREGDFVVPQRMTSNSAVYLHPARVPKPLLQKLNPDKDWGVNKNETV